MADETNNYYAYTQIPTFLNASETSEFPEPWRCPIEYVGENELGYHPYSITTLPGISGHKHHFSTKSVWEWVSRNHTNPMTREYIPPVEMEKLKRRCQILDEYPLLDKRVSIDFDKLFSDPTCDKSVLHNRITISSLPCFFQLDTITPSERRNAAKEILKNKEVGSWLIRKGSIKSVEKAAGTNTPANSYVIMIKRSEDRYSNIPFIHFFGYGFRICHDFTRSDDLTVHSPSLEDTTNWYFTFADLLTHPELSELEFNKAICVSL